MRPLAGTKRFPGRGLACPRPEAIQACSSGTVTKPADAVALDQKQHCLVFLVGGALDLADDLVRVGHLGPADAGDDVTALQSMFGCRAVAIDVDYEHADLVVGQLEMLFGFLRQGTQGQSELRRAVVVAHL